MTILNVTITQDAAFISQDTFASSEQTKPADAPRPIITSDMNEAIGSAFTGNGSRPELEPATFMAKIAAVPHLRLLVGGTGTVLGIMLWRQMLMNGIVPAGDIVELNAIAPKLLSRLRDRMPAGGDFIVCYVGWSRWQDRPCGFLYSSVDEFRPVSLDSGAGHNLMPAPDVEDPEYEHLADAWTKAAYGERTAEFHTILAQIQHRAFWSGKYPDWTGIGGAVHIGRVDRQDITLQVAHEFDEAEPLAPMRDTGALFDAALAAMPHHTRPIPINPPKSGLIPKSVPK